jgi:hypothetical protein
MRFDLEFPASSDVAPFKPETFCCTPYQIEQSDPRAAALMKTRTALFLHSKGATS